jgi:hypothetical protein
VVVFGCTAVRSAPAVCMRSKTDRTFKEESLLRLAPNHGHRRRRQAGRRLEANHERRLHLRPGVFARVRRLPVQNERHVKSYGFDRQHQYGVESR